jgi:hypothetical protein
MLMPEAAMHEDRFPATREDYVRLAWQILPVYAKTETRPME